MPLGKGQELRRECDLLHKRWTPFEGKRYIWLLKEFGAYLCSIKETRTFQAKGECGIVSDNSEKVCLVNFQK